MIKEVGKYLSFGALLVSATFAFTKSMIDDENQALSSQLKDTKEKLKMTEGRQQRVIPPLSSYPFNKIKDTQAISIASEINSLEERRELLLNDLEEMSILSIDPKSEIGELSKDLANSKNLEIKRRALHSLFQIKEPQTLPILWTYFFNNKEEATSGSFPSTFEWIDLFFDLNSTSGVDFCLELIRSEDVRSSEIAYRLLDEKISEGMKVSEKQMQEMRNLAFVSDQADVRAKYKLLIANLKSMKNKAPQDSRSLYRILLDIEKKLQKK